MSSSIRTIRNLFASTTQMAEKNAGSLDPIDLDAMKAGDGSLPGGLSPDMLKSLVSNSEIMTLLQNPKMQGIMSAMMSGGSGAATKQMKQDPEAVELLARLQAAMETVVPMNPGADPRAANISNE